MFYNMNVKIFETQKCIYKMKKKKQMKQIKRK